MVPELTAEALRQSCLRYPDFLCVGVQKSATSWLDANLRRHPKLWLPPMKELQYFSELYLPRVKRWSRRQRQTRIGQILQQYRNTRPPDEQDPDYLALLGHIMEGAIGDSWYGRIFAHAPVESLCGEVTPDYAQMPRRGIAHVVALSPTVRIMLSLRDPIERSWSHIRMFARNRNALELSQLERIASQRELVLRANYPAMIARWRSLVPEERFHVFFMDEVAAEPAQVLSGVYRFLEVDCTPQMLGRADRPVHVGEEREIPPTVLNILKKRLEKTYREMAQLYPETGRRWAGRYY